MNKLIKGNLVLKNVADKDVDMYVRAGWKLANPIKNKMIANVKNSTKRNTIKK